MSHARLHRFSAAATPFTVAAVLLCLLMADATPIASTLLVPPLPSPKATTLLDGVYLGELTDDENLRLTSFNSLVGVTIRIIGRIKRPDQTIADLDFTHIPNTDRSAKATDFPLGAGYLLNLSVYASSGAPKSGQTFVNLRIVRGRTGATLPAGTLVQGSITANQDRAWPGSPIASSLDGTGYTRSVTGTNPAVNADVSETVPTNARWELLAATFTLTTSGTAGTRRPNLFLDDGATRFARIANPQTQGASDTQAYFWAQGLPLTTLVSAGANQAGLPTSLTLLAGQRIGSVLDGRQTGDDFAAPVLQLTEWLDV